MGNKWKVIQEILPNDDDLTRVVHWCHYKGGQTSVKRANLVKELRRRGWSVREIAITLGLTRRTIERLVKGILGAGTSAALAMPISLAPLEIAASPSQPNCKPTTGSARRKDCKAMTLANISRMKLLQLALSVTLEKTRLLSIARKAA